MSRRINRAGFRVGRLTVIEFHESRSSPGRPYWLCRCDCGATTSVQWDNLRHAAVRSCGCLKIDRTKEANTKHGLCVDYNISPTHNVWSHMKQRCANPNSASYPNYGGRGIKVCDRWIESFATFLEDMGPQPEGHYPSGYPLYTLDRIDNNGNYEPGNCRWALSVQQEANQRVSLVRVQHLERQIDDLANYILTEYQ